MTESALERADRCTKSDSVIGRGVWGEGGKCMVQMTESALPASTPFDMRQQSWERGLGGGGGRMVPDLTLRFADVPSVLAVFFFQNHTKRVGHPQKMRKKRIFRKPPILKK